ncbi:hypothetical protein EUAN_12320 [Andreesenia angusta]|uniref:Uncharacterized protein n=1 Tax=Andreesenia angusta TaxID=39480 RepID=A0A1S1V692_9FIRM|nr:hypothetical protein [Andreesenia angusta]OHW62163.1 hypothetical protein EUAN_12320 [Andreesenia angusta]
MRGLEQIFENLPRPRPSRNIIEIAVIVSLSPLAIEIEGQRYSSEHWNIFVPLNFKIVQESTISVVNHVEAIVEPYDLVNRADDRIIELKLGDLVSVVDRGDNFIVFNRVKKIGGGA